MGKQLLPESNRVLPLTYIVLIMKCVYHIHIIINVEHYSTRIEKED